MVSECMANIMEAAFGYMDGVEILGYTFSDILLGAPSVKILRQPLGAILNRSQKTVVVGLDS